MRLKRCVRIFFAMLTGFAFLYASSTFAQLTDKKRGNNSHNYCDTDSVQVQQLLHQSDFYLDIQLDSSLHYAQRSVELAKTHTSKQLLARAYAKLGVVLFRRSEFDKCQAALQRVYQLSCSWPPDSTLLTARIFTAMLYRTRGNYREGLQLALAALKMYETQPAHYGREVAYLLTELGVIYDHLHNSRTALVYHQRRLRFSGQGGNNREQCVALYNLGYFYLSTSNYKQAHHYTHQALEAAYRLKNHILITYTLGSLGTIAFSQQRYRRAAMYHQAVIKMARLVGKKEDVGINLTQLAKDYEAMGKYTRAERCARQSVHVLKSMRSAYHLQTALLVESRILERLSRFQEALTVARQGYVLADSLVGIDKQKAIAQLQARYDLNQKQQQIASLNKNLVIQQQATRSVNLKLSLARQQRFLYLISALLLSLVLAVGYVSYRKQKQAGIWLEQQKEEIVQQAQQMEELNRTKDKLLSLISHDLRAPIGRLKYSIFKLRNTAQSTPVLQPPLTELDSQVDHILILLTNLLDWSLLQMKGFQANNQPVDLSDIVEDAVSQMAIHLQQKKIILINQVTSQTFVYADRHHLACIMRNILGNAIKFTPDEGYIRLHANREVDNTQLIIQDTGVGMSVEQLDQLLTNPEIRTGTRGEPSTGLGVRLCAELITHLSGTLHITSQPKKGTTVQISLQTI